MNQKFLAFVLVIVASVVAAGTGAYLALRNSGASAARIAAPEQTGDEAGLQAEREGVAETEGVIDPAPVAVDAAGSDPGARAAGSAVAARRPEGSRSQPQGVANAGGRLPREATTSPGTRKSAEQTTSTGGAPASVNPEPSAAPLEYGRTPETPLPPPAMTAGESAWPAPERERLFTELTVSADSVIGLQVENTITTESARIEDRVDARVTRDVRAGGQVAIPAGSRMEGSVTMVERGGKVKERARLGVRFHTLVLADGSRLPVQTETIFREGESPAGESAAKIGGAAVGGAIIGAILGGGKGAAIGGSIGAGGGAAAVMAGDRNPATLPAGSTVTVRLQSPVRVTVEQ
jgi:hypothetical protein